MNILACTTNVCLTGFTCLTVDNAGRECLNLNTQAAGTSTTLPGRMFYTKIKNIIILKYFAIFFRYHIIISLISDKFNRIKSTRPQTCNISFLGTCVNIATNCIQLAYLCNDRLYSSLMTQRCPQTCNRCNASAGRIFLNLISFLTILPILIATEYPIILIKKLIFGY